MDQFISYFPFSSLTNEESKYKFEQELKDVDDLYQNPELRIFGLLRFGDINLDGYKDLLLNV